MTGPPKTTEEQLYQKLLQRLDDVVFYLRIIVILLTIIAGIVVGKALTS